MPNNNIPDDNIEKVKSVQMVLSKFEKNLYNS
ncbi:hypothetical protein BH23THE1_BH23THE1_23940 [soil metagenome]